MPLVAVKPNLDGSLPIAPTEAQPLVVDRTTNRLLVDIGSSVALDNLNVNTDQIEGKQDVTNALLTTTAADVANLKVSNARVPGFSLPTYDYISCSYTSSNLTGVVYKTGGSGGTTVATLTLGYDGSNNLTSVTKS